MHSTSPAVHRLPDVPLISDRRGFIARACKNRSVLHLGCADWPLTGESLKDGTHLHSLLSKVSNRLFGVDLCEPGLSVLKAHGFVDLIQWDAECLGELRLGSKVDVIVAGEILEHLSNPGLCLEGISSLMVEPECKLIVSVPNAFSIRHFVPFMFRKVELVLPDHTAYYSLNTLSQLVRRYGLQVSEIYHYAEVSRKTSPLKRFAKRVLNATVIRAFPQVAEGIIAVIQRQNGYTDQPQFAGASQLQVGVSCSS
jgi:2-polyprenyl-3-methyl-5-hydroxy-6-metoxy-1,4-benzoquinol methylase